MWEHYVHTLFLCLDKAKHKWSVVLHVNATTWIDSNPSPRSTYTGIRNPTTCFNACPCRWCSLMLYSIIIASPVTRLCLLYCVDPPDQLCFHGSRAEWQEPLWVLHQGSASWLLPGPSHVWHRQGHGLELCFLHSLWGQLRREWCWCLPADIQRSRFGFLIVFLFLSSVVVVAAVNIQLMASKYCQKALQRQLMHI